MIDLSISHRHHRIPIGAECCPDDTPPAAHVGDTNTTEGSELGRLLSRMDDWADLGERLAHAATELSRIEHDRPRVEVKERAVRHALRIWDQTPDSLRGGISRLAETFEDLASESTDLGTMQGYLLAADYARSYPPTGYRPLGDDAGIRR